MAASEALFSKLADALGRPSKAYRAAEAGLSIPTNAIEGYKEGLKTADEIRKRNLQKQTLQEALGGNMPAGLEGFGATSVEQADALARPIASIAELRKATTPKTIPEKSYSQVPGVLFNGRPGMFDPTPGAKNHMFYADTGEPIDFGAGNVSTTGGAPIPSGKPPTNITPRVAPEIPGGEVSKVGDLQKLLEDVPTVRQNYRPEFVGPIDSLVTSARQKTGYGATPEAANFKATLAGMRNKVLNLLSGAAISPAEGARLMQQLPNENMSEVDFNAKLNDFENSLRDQINTKSAAFSRSGYRGASGLSQSRPQQQQTAPQPKQHSDPLGLFQ